MAGCDDEARELSQPAQPEPDAAVPDELAAERVRLREIFAQGHERAKRKEGRALTAEERRDLTPEQVAEVERILASGADLTPEEEAEVLVLMGTVGMLVGQQEFIVGLGLGDRDAEERLLDDARELLAADDITADERIQAGAEFIRQRDELRERQRIREHTRRVDSERAARAKTGPARIRVALPRRAESSGRPRAHATRSSARSGDSGDEDSEHVAHRRLAAPVLHGRRGSR